MQLEAESGLNIGNQQEAIAFHLFHQCQPRYAVQRVERRYSGGSLLAQDGALQPCISEQQVGMALASFAEGEIQLRRSDFMRGVGTWIHFFEKRLIREGKV